MESWQENGKFANSLAQLCCEHFKKLSKKGKPQSKNEWTLLAAIVQVIGDYILLSLKINSSDVSLPPEHSYRPGARLRNR